MEALAVILAGAAVLVGLVMVIWRELSMRRHPDAQPAVAAQPIPPAPPSWETGNSPSGEIPTEIRDFLEGILLDSGKQTLDHAARELMIVRLSDELNRFIAAKLSAHLPSDSLSTLRRMSEDQQSADDIARFIIAELSGSDEFILRTFSEFHDFHVSHLTRQCSRGLTPV